MRNMPNKVESYRKVFVWVSVFVGLASILLLGPVRLLLVQQELVSIKPFMPSSSIHFVIGGMIMVSIVVLYTLYKMNIDERSANIVILATAVLIIGFSAFVLFKLLVEQKPDLQQPVRAAYQEDRGLGSGFHVKGWFNESGSWHRRVASIKHAEATIRNVR